MEVYTFLVDFNLIVATANCQTTKFNFPPIIILLYSRKIAGQNSVNAIKDQVTSMDIIYLLMAAKPNYKKLIIKAIVSVSAVQLLVIQ